MAVSFTSNGNGYIDCGSDASLNGLSAFTYWAIIQVTNTTPGTNPRLISKGDDVKEFVLDSAVTRAIKLYVGRATTNFDYSAAVGSTGILAINTWYFVAGTFDASDSAKNGLFVAGMEEAVAEVSAYASSIDGSGAADSDAANSLWLGNRSTGTTNRAGTVDIAKAGVINEALSVGQLNNLKACHAHTGAKGYWECWTDSGTINDLSGNGNNGSVNGTVNPADHSPTPPPFGFDNVIPFPAAAAPPAAAIPTLLQTNNVGFDLYNGTIV